MNRELANNMAAVGIRSGEKDQQRQFIANCKILHQMIRIGSQLAPTSRNLSPRYHPSQGLSMLYFAFSFFFFNFESMKLKMLKHIRGA